jgi:hypothetical protein
MVEILCHNALKYPNETPNLLANCIFMDKFIDLCHKFHLFCLAMEVWTFSINRCHPNFELSKPIKFLSSAQCFTPESKF